LTKSKTRFALSLDNRLSSTACHHHVHVPAPSSDERQKKKRDKLPSTPALDIILNGPQTAY
jgi:hypothetical protein